MTNRIRDNSLVKYRTNLLTDALAFKLPGEFQDGTPIIFYGEIPNLPGRGIFASKNHRYIGFKIDYFEEVPPDGLGKIYFDSAI